MYIIEQKIFTKAFASPRRKSIRTVIYYCLEMNHLLFMLDFYAPHRGGIENVFENIISRLLKKGYQISLITSQFDKNLAQQESL